MSGAKRSASSRVTALSATRRASDWLIVQWAIGGHHPAYNRPSPPRLAVDGAGEKLTLLLGHAITAARLLGMGLVVAPTAWLMLHRGIAGPTEVPEQTGG